MARVVVEVDILVTLRMRHSREGTPACAVVMVHATNLCKKRLLVKHSAVDTPAFATAMAREMKPGMMTHYRAERLQLSGLARSWEMARAT